MFLSNHQVFLAVLLWIVAFALGCGSPEKAGNTASGTPIIAPGELAKGEQPFAAKEPDVYQTEVFYSSSGTSDKYFVARNGAMRRFDTYNGDRLTATELIKDNARYVIDHVRKLYYSDPPSEKGPKAVNPAALAFFQNTQHHEFDEIGRSNGQITYHAKKAAGDPDQDTVITIDEKTALMIKQEVKGKDEQNSFTFELRNVKLEAPDDLFQIPGDYKQVTKDQFKPAPKVGANSNADLKKAHE